MIFKKVIEFKSRLKEFEALELPNYAKEHTWGLTVRDKQHVRHLKIRNIKQDEFDTLSTYIAQNIPRMRRIAESIGIATKAISYPAPAVGGPVIEVCMLGSVFQL